MRSRVACGIDSIVTVKCRDLYTYFERSLSDFYFRAGQLRSSAWLLISIRLRVLLMHLKKSDK